MRFVKIDVGLKARLGWDGVVAVSSFPTARSLGHKSLPVAFSMSRLMCLVSRPPVLVFLRDSDWPSSWQRVYFGITHSRF